MKNVVNTTKRYVDRALHREIIIMIMRCPPAKLSSTVYPVENHKPFIDDVPYRKRLCSPRSTSYALLTHSKSK